MWIIIQRYFLKQAEFMDLAYIVKDSLKQTNNKKNKNNSRHITYTISDTRRYTQFTKSSVNPKHSQQVQNTIE